MEEATKDHIAALKSQYHIISYPVINFIINTALLTLH